MCGILGVVSREAVHETLRRGAAIQRHRGPDAGGDHVESVAGWTVGFSHQRLSIIDLSPTGAQPMRCGRGGVWITYNGEVYNYVELREELARLGWTFRGTSDTEVMLAALQQWGADEALRRFNGMWAFAALDVNERRLMLCRDRFGVKPLYVHREGERVIFASEIKTILAMCGRRFDLNLDVVADYVGSALLDGTDQTFLQGIEKVPAGTHVTFDLSRPTLDGVAKRYWTIGEHPTQWSKREAPEQLRSLLTDAVKIRLRSDVPVGLMLSGGLDSSCIAASMRTILGPGGNLNLLSAVSRDPRYDESRFADTVAAHVGGIPHRVDLSLASDRWLANLEEVCWVNDEPPASFSVVATFLLMKVAKELGITVVLSGQGADELLCGYRKFVGFETLALVRQRRLLRAALFLSNYVRRGTAVREFTLGEAARYLPASVRPKGLDLRGARTITRQLSQMGFSADATVQDRQIADFTKFSIPPITHYEDRASMAWSREIRSPFLDYRLVDAMIRAPIEWKLHAGWTKYLLRQAFAAELPPEIVWRRDKKGFDTPEGEWLRNTARQLTDHQFAPDALIFRHGLVDRDRLLTTYSRYQRQTSALGNIAPRHIFAPLALELWLRRYEANIASA